MKINPLVIKPISMLLNFIVRVPILIAFWTHVLSPILIQTFDVIWFTFALVASYLNSEAWVSSIQIIFALFLHPLMILSMMYTKFLYFKFFTRTFHEYDKNDIDDLLSFFSVKKENKTFYIIVLTCIQMYTDYFLFKAYIDDKIYTLDSSDTLFDFVNGMLTMHLLLSILCRGIPTFAKFFWLCFIRPIISQRIQIIAESIVFPTVQMRSRMFYIEHIQPYCNLLRSILDFIWSVFGYTNPSTKIPNKFNSSSYKFVSPPPPPRFMVAKPPNFGNATTFTTELTTAEQQINDCQKTDDDPIDKSVRTEKEQ